MSPHSVFTVNTRSFTPRSEKGTVGADVWLLSLHAHSRMCWSCGFQEPGWPTACRCLLLRDLPQLSCPGHPPLRLSSDNCARRWHKGSVQGPSVGASQWKSWLRDVCVRVWWLPPPNPASPLFLSQVVQPWTPPALPTLSSACCTENQNCTASSSKFH